MDTELVSEILNGAYDLHTHSKPSLFPRSLNDLELIQEADSAGMAGVLIKSHYEPTVGRANLINEISGCKAKAYGGVVLNWPVGGLNSFAAINALEQGAIIVWMPTRDAFNSLNYGDMRGDFFKRSGISVIDENGKLLKEVYEVMDVVRQYGAYLATGHISPAESVLLCKEGRKAGVKMILTHPEWPRTIIDAGTQAELACLGVLIEKNWINIAEQSLSACQMSEHIRLAGIQNVFLATDLGQARNEHPVDGMRRFVEVLLCQGFSKEELITMVRRVPERIVEGK